MAKTTEEKVKESYPNAEIRCSGSGDNFECYVLGRYP